MTPVYLECIIKLLFLNLEDRLAVLQARPLALHTPVVLLKQRIVETTVQTQAHTHTVTHACKQCMLGLGSKEVAEVSINNFVHAQ